VIVLDTSAALEYLADFEYGPWVADHLLTAEEIHVPHLIDVEIVGALRRLVRDRRIGRRRAESALSALIDLELTRHGHLPLVARMWDLRSNVRASDAAFVALAEVLGAPLVTIDRPLSRAPGVRATIVTP
jgi:predicted nucleic acid-binding protein